MTAGAAGMVKKARLALLAALPIYACPHCAAAFPRPPARGIELIVP